MDPELPQIFLASDPDDSEEMEDGDFNELGESGSAQYSNNNGDSEPGDERKGYEENAEEESGSEDDDSGSSDDTKSSNDDDEDGDEVTHQDNGERSSSSFPIDNDMDRIQEAESPDRDEEDEDGDDDDDDEESDSSSSGSRTTSSSSSQRRFVVKNVEYFAKLNLDRYLKRRGFDVYQKPPLTIGLDKLVEGMKNSYHVYNRPHAISSGTNYHGDDIVREVERFWQFYLQMKAEDSTVAVQLKSLLIPMLVSFYRECLLCGSIQSAVKMFVLYVQKFYQETPSKENQILLSLLANTSCSSNFQVSKLKNHPLMKQLSAVQYKFNVTPWVFERLQTFIHSSNSPVIPNLLTQRFVINVLVNGTGVSDEIQAPNDDESNAEDENTLVQSEIHSVLHQLRGALLPNLPSVLVYTTNGRTVSGAISKQGSTVAYGMEGAGIRIFEAPLVQTGLKSYNKIPAEEIGSQYKTQLLSGHAGTVNGLSFHPRAKYLFSVGEDALMRVWDTHNSICRALYRGHHCPVWTVDISSSGNLIVTGSMDTTARIWVPERTDFVRLLVGHYFDVDCVKFHPNEAYVGTGSVDKSVRLWSVSNGNLVRMFTGSKGAVNALSFHEGGRYIAAGGEDNLIRIWELGEGKLLAQLEGNNHCQDLCFHGNMLAAAYANGNIQVWNTRDLLMTSSGNVENEDAVADCETSMFPSKAERIVKLHYKSPMKLFCLSSSRKVKGPA